MKGKKTPKKTPKKTKTKTNTMTSYNNRRDDLLDIEAQIQALKDRREAIKRQTRDFEGDLTRALWASRLVSLSSISRLLGITLHNVQMYVQNIENDTTDAELKILISTGAYPDTKEGHENLALAARYYRSHHGSWSRGVDRCRALIEAYWAENNDGEDKDGDSEHIESAPAKSVEKKVVKKAKKTIKTKPSVQKAPESTTIHAKPEPNGTLKELNEVDSSAHSLSQRASRGHGDGDLGDDSLGFGDNDGFDPKNPAGLTAQEQESLRDIVLNDWGPQCFAGGYDEELGAFLVGIETERCWNGIRGILDPNDTFLRRSWNGVGDQDRDVLSTVLYDAILALPAVEEVFANDLALFNVAGTIPCVVDMNEVVAWYGDALLARGAVSRSRIKHRTIQAQLASDPLIDEAIKRSRKRKQALLDNKMRKMGIISPEVQNKDFQ